MQTVNTAHCADQAPSSAAIPGRDGGRRYPFLPPSSLGWTPYVWLVYLSFFFIDPLFNDNRPWEYAACAAVLAVFLPVYFWGYWQQGRRVLVAVFVIAGLGAVASPWNGGSSVFFIYASGYLGAVGPPRVGLRWLAVLVAWIVAEGWLFGLPAYWWVTALVFTLMVAGLNIHFTEVGRRDAALRRSQQEVERLAKVAERERIGRDLHDLLGHTLSLITLKAELAGKLMAAEPERAAAEIADVERISRRALREVREAVAGYRSAGFAAELGRADAALTAAGIEGEAAVDPRALAAASGRPEAERVLSFVLREAVTNVVRHSEAARCELALALESDGDLILSVADDGRGGLGPEGFGLSGMRERLASVGGRLERDGDGGTRLTARLPPPTEAPVEAPAAGAPFAEPLPETGA